MPTPDQVGRAEYVRNAVDLIIDDFTRRSAARFGGKAVDLARTIRPLPLPPNATGADFIEVLLSWAIPWSQEAFDVFGRAAVHDLIADCLAPVMRAFGARAARGEETLTGRIERALAPIPPDTLVITDRHVGTDTLSFRVTRCGYAERLRQLGLSELGEAWICDSDFAIAEGLGLELSRSRTLMRTGRPCDFRYAAKR